jgi:hypothetical protein
VPVAKEEDSEDEDEPVKLTKRVSKEQDSESDEEPVKRAAKQQDSSSDEDNDDLLKQKLNELENFHQVMEQHYKETLGTNYHTHGKPFPGEDKSETKSYFDSLVQKPKS